LVGGVLAGFVASYYGPFIVQRRLAFLGSGLSHAAFGGVALGLLAGIAPIYVALPFTVAVACAIVWVRQQTVIQEDTAIGIFFAVSMALGIIFLSMTPGYTGDAFAYLFGSILAITWGDVAIIGAMALLTVCLWPRWQAWAYATFDRTLAEADRLAVVREDYLLAAVLAASVVVAIKVVGIVLLASFLVLPAASARLCAHTFRTMTLLSVILGTTSVAMGLFLSYYLDMPSGPVIILTQASVFCCAIAIGRFLE
ncbi:MAG: metal ABC transporter permease, partial [Candidatus Hydrogenedentes bacterium]|nr:metal ABC transporter permease [Candidatus Hydrogenedentota bacterium]